MIVTKQMHVWITAEFDPADPAWPDRETRNSAMMSVSLGV